MKKEWMLAHYNDIISNTEKATLFLFDDKEVWIPNKLFRFSEGGNIKIPPFVATEKKINASKVKIEYHRPEKIDPVYNQEAISELIYEKIS